jgi:hypothetical protein
MYWDINEDDQGVNGTSTPCDFATGFNNFLHVR